MPTTSLRPRSARTIPLSVAALLLGGAPSAAAAPASSTQATTPHLSARWAVLRKRCSDVSPTSRVGPHHHTRTEHLRRCAMHAYSIDGHAMRLAWHERGEVRGRLTLAGAPIAGATITITDAIRHQRARTMTITTGPRGRYSGTVRAPSGRVSVSYVASPTLTLTSTRRVAAAGYLSLHVGRLRAGHDARFSGQVAGGYMPEDTYVELWYLAGRSGWQPFAGLAHVHRRSGWWTAEIPIPRAAAHYRYAIHATVVKSPYWPYTHAQSALVKRRVA
jgi:hypothetical protein